MLHTVYQATTTELNSNCQGDQMKSPTCNDLGDNRSSHVNLYFWKLHGLVDGFVGKWLDANGYKEVAADCGKRPGCYQWQGTYMGSRAPGMEAD